MPGESINMIGNRLPLFIVEEQIAEDNWRSLYLRRSRFQELVCETSRAAHLPFLRARRVKTLEEAQTLAVPIGCSLWLKWVSGRIEWPPIKETP